MQFFFFFRFMRAFISRSFLLLFFPPFVPVPGLSVPVKRTQGDSKHIAEDYGRKSSGSSAKVPPSPLSTADRKKTPTPSTVSSPFLPVSSSGVGSYSVTVFDADFFLSVPYRTASFQLVRVVGEALQVLRDLLWAYRMARTGTYLSPHTHTVVKKGTHHINLNHP